jgi:WD40 repeat protein
VTASSYTGHGVVLSDGKITTYKTHDAAVTDVYLAFGGLLTSSDDGSVILSDLDEHAAPQVLATGQGVARVILPDASGDAAKPTFFAGFDSGRVAAVTGSQTRTFEAGVGRINGLAQSADRASLYVAGFNGRVRRIEVATGKIQDVFAAGSDINAIALDDTTSKLAIVSDSGRLVVLDTRSGKTIVDTKLADVPLTAVALASGGGPALIGDAAGILYLLELPVVPVKNPE